MAVAVLCVVSPSRWQRTGLTVGVRLAVGLGASQPGQAQDVQLYMRFWHEGEATACAAELSEECRSDAVYVPCVCHL